MKTPEQIIIELEAIKTKIQNSTDRNEICRLIQDAIEIGKANQATPYAGFSDGQNIADHGKKMIIALLETDKSTAWDENLYDIPSVHFQTSASILMLMNKYVHGLDEIGKIIKK